MTHIYTWAPRSYYILMNKVSGKKYMGQTTQDLNTYLGSGSYWKNHCNKHGGYTRDNIVLIESISFDKEQDARDWLYTFEQLHPGYYTEDNTAWCNLVRETTEDSPFKSNMTAIFEKHGNPFSGGNIQKQAWTDGKYAKRDQSTASKKGWINRDKQEARDKMLEGHMQWRKDNHDAYIANQRKAAAASAKKLRKRIVYNNTVYYGWDDLKAKTGLSKYKFVKHELGTFE